ncbi:MAG: hypothetical protein AB1634_18525 [Thermodesulfobacteriota bacterium]
MAPDPGHRHPSVSLLAFLAVLACLAGGCLPAARNESSAADPAPVAALPAAPAAQPAAPLPGSELAAPQASARPHPGWPLTDFSARHFLGAARCDACHDLLTDAQGNDMSITRHWRSTMMANAAKDPFWQAKVASEVVRLPGLAPVIETKCANCHMPMAYVEATAEGGANSPVAVSAILAADHPLHEAGMDGVSCTLCHQIQDRNLGRPEGFSGAFVIDTSAQAPDRPLFGPYPDPVTWPMATSVRYTPTYSQHVNDSAFCATCHTLYTPYVNARGEVAGVFPEQTAYLEWQHSIFGQAVPARYDLGESPGPGRLCQECHMPHSQHNPVTIARYAPSEVQAKDHFSQHLFVGGNAFMLTLMADNLAPLGLTASTEHLEATRARTVRQLQQETATLAITGRQEAGRLETLVTVASLAGHKLPTGFPSRMAWLHVTVLDGQGQPVFESGRPLPDGRIAGNDADRDPTAFEPHYDRISDPDEVQIYEAVMQDTEGRVTRTLLRAAGYRKDNRLLPQGFAKEAVPADIAVYGAARQDANFSGGSDQVAYSVSTAGRSGPFTVRAELLYQAVPASFVADLGDTAAAAPVARFLDMYAGADKTPVAITAAYALLR